VHTPPVRDDLRATFGRTCGMCCANVAAPPTGDRRGASEACMNRDVWAVAGLRGYVACAGARDLIALRREGLGLIKAYVHRGLLRQPAVIERVGVTFVSRRPAGATSFLRSSSRCRLSAVTTPALSPQCSKPVRRGLAPLRSPVLSGAKQDKNPLPAILSVNPLVPRRQRASCRCVRALRQPQREWSL